MFDEENIKDNVDDLNSEHQKESSVSRKYLEKEAPKSVEDIFFDTDSSVIDSSAPEHTAHEPEIDSMEIGQQGKRKVFVLLFMFLGVVIIGWGTYFVFGKIVKKVWCSKS